MKLKIQLIAILAFVELAKASSTPIIGVSPAKQSLYEPIVDETTGLKTWHCLSDPSIILSYDQVNDNYCDCPDGSDEPGTNACPYNPSQKFYCENKGHFPNYIENFKLNDNVCDYEVCCDGSDEYLTGACDNKCDAIHSQFLKYKDEVTKDISKSLVIKRTLIEKAEVAKQRVVDKLNETNDEMEAKEASIKEIEKRMKVAEAQEHELSENIDDPITTHENQQEVLDARPYFSVITIAAKIQQYFSSLKDDLPNKRDNAKSIITEKSHKQSTILLQLDSQIEELKKDLKSLQSEASIYQENLKIDFGEDDILRAVVGSWVTGKLGEYAYKVGFMDSIYQDNTLIGKYAGYENGRLLYTRGSKCWNGPQRSGEVELICGSDNRLLAVGEPEKCEYHFQLTSPIACKKLTEDEILSNFKIDRSLL